MSVSMSVSCASRPRLLRFGAQSPRRPLPIVRRRRRNQYQVLNRSMVVATFTFLRFSRVPSPSPRLKGVSWSEGSEKSSLRPRKPGGLGWVYIGIAWRGLARESSWCVDGDVRAGWVGLGPPASKSKLSSKLDFHARVLLASGSSGGYRGEVII